MGYMSQRNQPLCEEVMQKLLAAVKEETRRLRKSG
jgi:hypothetical protein